MMTAVERLSKIHDEVMVCGRCRLAEQRRNAVPGEGNASAEMMFVGEAPGRQEDLRGRPFVGAAGRFLDELLHEAGFSRDAVYITNVIKCRPPRNRDPRPDEIATCAELYLARQIQAIRPKLLIMLGRHSTSYILSEEGIKVDGITKVRGRRYEIKSFGFPIVAMPMLHPAASLYNAKYKDMLKHDFRILSTQVERLRH
jgi:DNA polymerase